MQTHADVWYVFPGAIRNPELLDVYRAILSDDEISRYKRFFFEAAC